MPRIIKSEGNGRASVSAYERAFLNEAASDASHATTDPAMILEQARAEAEEKVQEAFAEGMRRGIVAGEEKFNESVGETARMLSQAVETLQQARQEFLDETRDQMHNVVDISHLGMVVL